MKCDKDFLILLSAYADGETNNNETQKVITHLEICSDCRNLLEEWQGQKQVMQWAFTQSLLESDCQVVRTKQAKEISGAKMNNNINEVSIPIKKKIRWQWSFAVPLIIIFTFIMVVMYINQPQIIKVGDTLSTASAKESARLEGGVKLAIGPNSKIVRLSEDKIRLEKGWVNAIVNGGSGISIITKRIEISDIGTKFKVRTTSKFDYVSVKEGSVIVKSKKREDRVGEGKILLAEDDEKLVYYQPSKK